MKWRFLLQVFSLLGSRKSSKDFSSPWTTQRTRWCPNTKQTQPLSVCSTCHFRQVCWSPNRSCSWRDLLCPWELWGWRVRPGLPPLESCWFRGSSSHSSDQCQGPPSTWQRQICGAILWAFLVCQAKRSELPGRVRLFCIAQLWIQILPRRSHSRTRIQPKFCPFDRCQLQHQGL